MVTYIEGFDERAVEIEKTFSYDGYQIVRREMFAHLREPAVTIRSDSITFNTACIEGFEDVVYIHVMVSDDEKRMVIRKCDENDKDSLRWCINKPDKRKSRVIKGRFSKRIYEIMQWSGQCRYKILGHRIQYQGETLYVFELENCEIFKERPKRTKAEREERAKSMTPEELAEADRKERKESMTPYSPEDLENTFGLPVNEHQNSVSLFSLSGYKEIESRTASSSSIIAINPENGVIVDALNIDNTTETENKVQAVSNPAFIGNTMPVNNTGNPVNVNLEAGSVNMSGAYASDRGLYE